MVASTLSLASVPPSALPTVAQLRAFCAVAEHLHFGAAAADLHISQPAVSAAVSGLEQTLKVRLVERTPRAVTLTPVGVTVAQQARDLLDGLADLARKAAGQGRRHCGPLRLGMIPTIAPYVLPAVLSSIRKSFPELAPAVTEDLTERLLDRLATGHLDLALIALPADAESMVELPIYAEDFVLAVPPASTMQGAADLDPSVLGDLDLLLLAEGHCLRDQTLDVCRQAGVDGKAVDAPAMSLTTISQLVASGLGATLLPATAVPVEARRDRLGIARFCDPVPHRRVGLVHRRGAARADEYAELADVLRKGLKRLPVRPLPDVTGPAISAA